MYFVTVEANITKYSSFVEMKMVINVNVTQQCVTSTYIVGTIRVDELWPNRPISGWLITWGP